MCLVCKSHTRIKVAKKLELVKENKKSDVYENDVYKVKISEIDGFFYKKNGEDYTDYDYELGDEDYKFVKAVKLEITNKNTGKTAQKRCYQGFSVIDDVQDDLDGDKTQFASMFKKIDK